ncbi:NAD+ synthase (glutamine-hydrolyzing) [Sporomusaceae bacterium BoRhaA]|uniref:NAD(+) synthase n=1 Tax=Pelorhabdus rhamnosifermentans TaxID=2772457 RepID=UPI001C062C0D|nr:NAD(+) synthase [Pelorhabdus rhamnosifermentans]MBU2702385.1 NAD+ synthase (glutamine-hydrolyzing) [Pelorhabdus rhamnosifermentans]
MLNIALGQMEVVPGRPDLNTQKMLQMISEARLKHADLIIFPELAIPGYLLGDLWEQSAFLRDCEAYGRQIAAAAQDIVIMFGNIGCDWNLRNNDGRVRKYNAFFTAQNGNFIENPTFPYPFRIKTLLPNYREFDDNRHFYSLQNLAADHHVQIQDFLQPITIMLNGKKLSIGCLICEDGWVDDYTDKPMRYLGQNHPIDLFVNISSSPFTAGKNGKRHRVFCRQIRKQSTPLIYVNQVGLQNNGKTVYTFDGCSTIYDSNGTIVTTCPAFTETLQIVPFDLKAPAAKSPSADLPDDQTIASLYEALVYGMEKFLESTGIKRIVIGISGGIDSAVNAALYARIIDPDRILLVNMPSRFNSKTTISAAEKLAKNLHCQYCVLPIEEAANLTMNQLTKTAIQNTKTGQNHYLTLSDLVKENIQARDRSSRLLAGVAAAFGGAFTCNANKSEMTVGYCTLYGDEAGFLAATADLWKYQIYELAHYLNEHIYQQEVIPRETIEIVPSAELSAAQSVDEGKGDPIIYPYHDFLFRSFVERWDRATPEDILTWYVAGVLEEKLGCNQGVVKKYFATPKDFTSDLERWWNLYTGMGLAKRIQAPPVLAVSRRAFGFDHREAQNKTYYTRTYTKMKEQLLHEGDPHYVC